MNKKTFAVFAAAIVAAVLLLACGTSTTGPVGGSRRVTDTGVSSSGYPAGQPADAETPALASSTELKYSVRTKDFDEAPDPSNPDPSNKATR